ncbi:O-antigen ligase family protein [Cedecea neteri]|uniref:O-antigen ligase family protein n=1 Tax=Cedecea neteri TaxID=158822 RepID=UPI002892E758|nr:O-antigen ligase family protein [Cedecea neteri]WNJ81166.1 O-antigen ligase family protein [Cedecea neteri]
MSDNSTLLQIILGLHAFVFYPMVFTFLFEYFYNTQNELYWNSVLKFLEKLLCTLFIVMSIIAIIDVFSNGTFTLLLGYNPNYGGDGFQLITRYYDLVRANGGFADALAFGYLMVAGFIFFIYRIKNTKDKMQIINVIGVVLTSLAVVLSITRGAIIALVVASLFYLYKSRVWVRASVFLLSVSVVLVISLSDYSGVFMGRFTDSDKGSQTSTNLRYEMALKSIDYLTEHPMGVGLGTQGAGSTLTKIDERVNTDNFIFHSFLELGIVNGSLFILFILSQFRIIYVNTKKRREIFFALFSLYIISAAFSSALQSGTLSVIFWIIAFIISADSRMKNSREQHSNNINV